MCLPKGMHNFIFILSQLQTQPFSVISGGKYGLMLFTLINQ